MDCDLPLKATTKKDGKIYVSKFSKCISSSKLCEYYYENSKTYEQSIDLDETAHYEPAHLDPSVLQIRRGQRDNLGIIFHITPLNLCWDPSLEIIVKAGLPCLGVWFPAHSNVACTGTGVKI